MSDLVPGASDEDALAVLQARADALERQLREVETQAASQLRHAELKAEAMRAGIVDLDGLRLLDPAVLSGADIGAADAINSLRQDKPWLFALATTSSAASPPPTVRTRRKLATEMSVEEWRAARADLLRRR